MTAAERDFHTDSFSLAIGSEPIPCIIHHQRKSVIRCGVQNAFFDAFLYPASNSALNFFFRDADEADAVQAADFIGKKRIVKRSWGFSAGKRNVNYSETEEHKIKPHKLRSLRDHQCIVVHCEKGFRRTVLLPLEPDGNVSPWFKRSWL